MRTICALYLSTFEVLAVARKCIEITVPVAIFARNAEFSVEPPATNIEVTNFILDLTRQGYNLTDELLEGYATVSGTYHLAATYCEPDAGPSSVLQVLTHGIGFDRSYWDLPFNNYNYSYVAEATDQYGYSTFAWDRLGIGASSRGDPVNEVQAFLEVAALKALSDKLRMGQISGIPCRYSTIVHVGHSFGSVQTYTLTQYYPDVSDAIVLTGFSQNGAFIGDFAFGGNFVAAKAVRTLSQYAAGYVAAGDVNGVQSNFFAPGQFDPALLYVAYKTGQPVTVGELLTIGGATQFTNSFAGVVLIITGERDIPFCGGDCLITHDPALSSIPAASGAMFPNASHFDAVIVPSAGHALNLEYSHDFTFGVILDFFVANVGR
ncbi:Ctr copper transporter family protein [Pleurostoma richardsiae]|uniref:Ctr copper transporter family protein n=1 Tax=Pleurostoma richardsiae TaxID=41990 RepID=A0AA38RJZ6_9PEZI|nr:Ctr copper transporter family protein [Pleurostoma richardsiae]